MNLLKCSPCPQVITSMNLPDETDHVVLLASTMQPQERGHQFQRLALRIPKIDAYFTGTGECCKDRHAALGVD